MKAQLFASGTFANGTAMRKIATDASRTASASRRSLRPAGSWPRDRDSLLSAAGAGPGGGGRILPPRGGAAAAPPAAFVRVRAKPSVDGAGGASTEDLRRGR